MMNSTISNASFLTAFVCAFVAFATIFEYTSDLAKLIREPGIKSISLGVVLAQRKNDGCVKLATNRSRDLSDKRRGLRGATVEEAFMLNRTTTIGVAIALAAALAVIVLVQPAIGPQASRAELGSPSIPVDYLHRQVDPNKLPIHSAPEP